MTAHSLGMISISADGEEYVNSVIIKKNTPIPTSNTKAFNFKTRAKNNELEIYVLQGDYKRPLDNTIINKYVISNIKKTTPPKSIIEVTYQYNSNGVIEVSATQKETGKKLPIKIEAIPEDMEWANGSPKDNQNNNSTPDVEVLLTVDLSGSMSGTPLAEAKKAMKRFVDEMDKDIVRIGLIPFANRTSVVLKPTNDYRKVKKAIDELIIDDEFGYGNSAHPFDLGLSELEINDADVKYIIVLTDGMWGCCDAAISSAKTCHKNNIEIMALGFGSADYSFLKKIASTDEFASLTDLSNLSGSFSKIAQVIGESSTGISVF